MRQQIQPLINLLIELIFFNKIVIVFGMCTKKVVNIFTAVIPLYNFLKLLGLFLPSFDKNFRKGITQPKLIDKIWALLTFCGFILIIFKYLTKLSKFASSSVILVNAYEACTIAGLLLVLILMIYQHKNCYNILKILKMLHEFDEEVRKL